MRIAVWQHSGTSTGYAGAIGIKATTSPPATYHEICDLTRSELGPQLLRKIDGSPVWIRR